MRQVWSYHKKINYLLKKKNGILASRTGLLRSIATFPLSGQKLACQCMPGHVFTVTFRAWSGLLRSLARRIPWSKVGQLELKERSWTKAEFIWFRIVSTLLLISYVFISGYQLTSTFKTIIFIYVMLKATYVNHFDKYTYDYGKDRLKNIDKSYTIIIVYLFGFMFHPSLPCAFVDTGLTQPYMS